MTESPQLIVDGILVTAVLLSFWGGWRQGAFASVLSTVGVLAGLICGAALAPAVMSYTDSTALRYLYALGTVLALVAFGNLIGGVTGSGLRESVRFRRTLIIDSVIGAIFQALATLIVTWLVASTLASGITGPIARGIRNSVVLGIVDKSTPDVLDTLPDKISAMLNDTGLPPMVSPFDGRVKHVDAPAPEVSDPALVEALRPSVIHVLGDAHQCRRRLMGSGFVAAPDLVITNAHVVAGTDEVLLDTVLGVKEARVVLYDPEEDIAVLRAENLDLPALKWAPEPAPSGVEAIVMGYPESGPFEAAPARIRERLTINGPDIYATGRVEREAYTVRGTIRQGNSGGPMVNDRGEVLGVVFGAATENTDVGYTLTADEVQGRIGDITQLTEPVDTRECVVR
ncbi:MarP family serine protease [Corynebacterium sp. CCM 9203]|uniref:MarP family serine protease n=1 Tax=Corynebacterium sp. CCM 9203 TaxID=3057615 RepID=UPI0035233D8A